MAVALVYVIMLIGATLAGYLPSALKPIVTVIGFTVLILAVFGAERIARRFARLQKREGTDIVDFPVERLREQLKEAEAAEISNEDMAESIETPAWTCPECREDVPSGFGLCWKCGRSYEKGA